MRSGTPARMISWTRLAIDRSGSGIPSIFSWMSRSPSARSSAGLLREACLPSWAAACMAARSSSLHTLPDLPDEPARLVAAFVSVISFVLSVRTAESGVRLLGDLPLLEDPDPVAEGIAKAHVGAVEVVGRLLREVGDPARPEGFVHCADVVHDEHEPAHRALGDQLAELRRRRLVVERRAGLL